MKEKIRHPRLNMFFKSSVMNLLLIWICVMVIGLRTKSGSSIWALAICSVMAILIVGYTVWFWIGKPRKVSVCPWLSDVSAIFTFYMIITNAITIYPHIWHLLALIGASTMSIIYLVKRKTRLQTKKGLS